MSNKTQRDAFFDRIYQLAKQDRDLVIVSADMSAPSLDKFRLDLPTQFVNVGIAEQNAIVIGSGLAFEGKKVFVYAISPFITLRCLEQIRVSNGINEIPITIVGMGTGLSYFSDGPTHHLIEDVAVMRAFPHINTLNTTDNVMVRAFADLTYNSNTTNYIRLDKDFYDDIYSDDHNFSKGLSKVKACPERSRRNSSKYFIVATGPMVHTACKIVEECGERNIGVIDLYKFPVNTQEFIESIKGVEKIITLEEHFLAGGMGSAVCEVLNDNGVMIPVKRMGLNSDFGYSMSYKYGGRDVIRKHYGIGCDKIKNTIDEFFD